MHRNQSGSTVLILAIIIALVLVGAISISRNKLTNKSQPAAAVSSFEACVKAGYHVAETPTHPPVSTCKTPDGKVFRKVSESKSGMKGRAVITSRQSACKTGEGCAYESYLQKYTVVVRLASAALKDDKATVMPELSRVEADDNGEFTIQLTPGYYTLEVPGNQPPTAKIQNVEVKNDAYTDVTIRFDSGIR